MADDRSRLEKLIGMLGSDFEGEQLNALRMIRALAAKEGKTLPQILLSGETRVVEKIVYRDAPMQHAYRPPQRSKYQDYGTKFTEDQDDSFRAGGEQQRGQRRQDTRKLLDALAKAAEEHKDEMSFTDYDFARKVPYEYQYDWQLSEKQKALARAILRRSKDSPI